MQRAELLGWLQREFAAITDELDLSTLDLSDGYRSVIDATWRVLGSTTGALALTTVDEDTDDVYAVAAYYALRRFRRFAAPRVNVGLGGGMQLTKARAQLFAHLTELLKEQLDELRRRGLLVVIEVSTIADEEGAAYIPIPWLSDGPDALVGDV